MSLEFSAVSALKVNGKERTQIMIITILIVTIVSCHSVNIPLATKMCEFPMVMAHDAATTYLDEGILRKSLLLLLNTTAAGTG